MSEQPHTNDIEQQADSLAAQALAAIGDDQAETRFEIDVLEPALQSGLLVMALVERLKASDDMEVRRRAAIYSSGLAADTPKDRYLKFAQELLVDPELSVREEMWDCFGPEEMNLTWSEVRDFVHSMVDQDYVVGMQVQRHEIGTPFPHPHRDPTTGYLR